MSSKLTICITYFIHYIGRLQLATDENQPPEVGTAKVVNNVQQNHNADVASSQPVATDSRIINMGLLNEHLKDVAAHAATCQAYQSKLQSEPRDDKMQLVEQARYGMASILSYKCDGCGQDNSFATSTKVDIPSNGKYWSCNVAAIWGQMSTGGGFNHLEESMGVLGVPVMSKQSFVNTEQKIGKWWWDQFKDSMQAAGKAERQLAIQENNYHQGVPAITVIVDAGWSKRTHKHTYNALSAVGVIFGKRTGKLLHLGVRNKYCSICKQDPTEEHDCYKNWSGSSSSMETDIILEGFLAAEKEHGVRYINFVGDGDSSVYPTLVSSVPGWGYSIKKQECANHALKCYRASLEQLIKDKPSYKGKHKLTENMRQKLTKAARCAIIMRSKESDKQKAAALLREDILNGPLHCFGSHHKCKSDYCKVVRSLEKAHNNVDKDNTSQTIPCPQSSETSSGSNNKARSNDETNSSFSSTCSNSTVDFTGSNDFNISTMDTSNSYCKILELSDIETEIEIVDQFFQHQELAWHDATSPAPTEGSRITDTVTALDSSATGSDTNPAITDSDTADVNLDPPHPIDHQMVCDINAIASRLASKAHQLLGM